MRRYLTQLREDIDQIIAYKAKLALSVPDEQDSLESFLKCTSEMEKYVNDSGAKVAIGKLTGILQEQLPSQERLDEGRKAMLSPLLEKLLHYFHFELDFPEKVPDAMRYSFIRDFWAELHMPMSIGMSHIEFCLYEKEICPFSDYCSDCEEITSDYKLE